MSGYKWRAGDWAQSGDMVTKVLRIEAAEGYVRFSPDSPPILLKLCIPVIVRPKTLPKKVKRSELRAWFERQNSAFMYTRSAGESWKVTSGIYDGHYGEGKTYEAAILALRKALRKAGKFTP